MSHREAHLGSALSLSYTEPLHVVLGRASHLYDARAAEYLDCVMWDIRTLTSSRRRQCSGRKLTPTPGISNDAALACAERLAALLPGGLDIVCLVNSGSEANELALRMARAVTGHRDVVVFDTGYHGSTSAMVEISGYKFDGPGGAGKPDWVHVVDTPGPGASKTYTAHVAERVPDGIAALFAESIIGCGGQILPEPGVMATLYDAVRASGGVCVAGEVPTGFGRVGLHWWAFELHDVVPDIVTVGKPAGNGSPLGAIITTAEIAAAFDGGMEYFNTFGGNPVSAAVGLAVLDVIEADGLREHATEVGAYLVESLLAIDDTRIVDVRGPGLFLGIELETGTIATGVVEHAKASRVLLEVDGPRNRVIKVKPPLVFDHHDADRLVAAIRSALGGLAQPNSMPCARGRSVE